MKRTYRRWLFFVSTVVYLALAPLIILYALGYRSQAFSAADPMPIGVVLVETIPSRADVYLDGEYVGRSPQALTDLKADEVVVAVQKQGYGRWEKKIRVKPGQTMELRDIRLWPIKRDVIGISLRVDRLAMAPNRKLIAIIRGRMLSVVDDEGEEMVSPVDAGHMVKSLLWSADSSQILVEQASGKFRILGVTGGKNWQVVKGLGQADEVVWDPRIANRLLYVDKQSGSLMGINVVNGKSVVLVRQVNSFATSGRRLYAVAQDNTVTAYNLQGEELEKIAAPEELIATLLVTPKGNIAYILTDSGLMVMTERGEIRELSKGLEKASWSPDGQMLFYQTDMQSLYVYNAKDERSVIAVGQSQLVARLSAEIVDAQWFAGSRHLVYQINDQLIISEIDNRDYVITYTIDSTNNGEAMMQVGEEGETVFYLKTNGGVTDLVKSSLGIE